MMIEPIRSAMTYQAQTQAKPAEKPAAMEANTEVGRTENEKAVDNTTVVIKEADEKEGQSNGSLGNDQTQSQAQQTSQDSIRKAVDQLNKKMSNSEAIFGIHDETNRVTIKIVDKDTKEVKKEYPAEKTLDMIQKVWEMAGLMVDEKR